MCKFVFLQLFLPITLLQQGGAPAAQKDKSWPAMLLLQVQISLKADLFFFDVKQTSVALSLSLSPFHLLNITKLPLKGL